MGLPDSGSRERSCGRSHSRHFRSGDYCCLDWNLYSPRWAPVRLADFPGASNRSLELQDREPYDYARAVRVFPEAEELTIKFKLLAKQANTGRLEIEILDRYGNRPPVRIHLDEKGRIVALDANQNDPVVLMSYQPDTWYGMNSPCM